MVKKRKKTKKKKSKRNSLPKSLKMSKKETREYHKLMSQRRVTSGPTVSLGAVFLFMSVIILISAKYAGSYEMFNILMVGGGILFIVGLANLADKK